ncbi:hypothetical protein N9131_00010 [bacterium]|jgi:hypothetical protein|nr:hypothetical protein [bacterium]
MFKTVLLLVLLTLTPASLFAGSRGVDLAFLDATTGSRSKASLRLAELLEKDMRELYLSPKVATLFPWSELELKLTVLNTKSSGIRFDRLLNTQNEDRITRLFETGKVQDGLIVFFHDEANGFARFKLYTRDGSEALLVRLPLEDNKSPMPNSLLKGHRHGALAAIGAAVRWTP